MRRLVNVSCMICVYQRVYLRAKGEGSYMFEYVLGFLAGCNDMSKIEAFFLIIKSIVILFLFRREIENVGCLENDDMYECGNHF